MVMGLVKKPASFQSGCPPGRFQHQGKLLGLRDTGGVQNRERILAGRQGGDGDFHGQRRSGNAAEELRFLGGLQIGGVQEVERIHGQGRVLNRGVDRLDGIGNAVELGRHRGNGLRPHRRRIGGFDVIAQHLR